MFKDNFRGTTFYCIACEATARGDDDGGSEHTCGLAIKASDVEESIMKGAYESANFLQVSKDSHCLVCHGNIKGKFFDHYLKHKGTKTTECTKDCVLPGILEKSEKVQFPGKNKDEKLKKELEEEFGALFDLVETHVGISERDRMLEFIQKKIKESK